MRRILAPFRGRVQGALTLLALLSGCGGRRSDFIGDRVQDQCNEQFPVCDQVVGCLIGPRSYLEGRLPGQGRFSILLGEPSVVTVSVFIDGVQSAGNETALTFYEDRCQSRIRTQVDGRVFVGEAEETGAFVRSADLFGVGEHLIELQSDAQAEYVLKVDVEPKAP